jgi:hypothetical protein
MASNLTPLQALSRYNQIMTNVYAIDNALRVVTYSIALYLASSPGVKSDCASWLAELKAKVADTRFLNRILVGLPASVEGYFAYGRPVTFEALLGKLMAFSMVLYHPLEHGWWATTLKPKLFDIDGDKWSMWSCRCWVAYVLMDLLGTLRRLQDLKDGAKGAGRERRNLLIWLTCIAADAPLAIQWSVPSGPFPDVVLNWAGWYGGVAGLYLRWLKLSGA